MDTTMLNLRNLFEQLVRRVELLSEGNELQFIQLAKDFEDFRKKWQRTDHELGKYKDLLMKAETERSALDVKLKHARNQVDVEIKRRQRAEADCEKLDWDSSLVKTFKLKKREKRRSSSRQFIDGPPGPVKKTRSIGSTVDQGNESIVAKTTVTVPNDGGPIEAVSTIETVPYWTRSRRKTGTLQPWNSDSTLSSRQLEPRTETDSSGTPQNNGGMRLHDFVSKTVIKPESCVPCGKRIKFGKLSLKCRDCRVVSHPECRDRCPLPCIPTLIGTPVKIGEGILADYVSQTSPMIPSIVVHCVNEIEQRGLTETGLYRISGCDRTVKELKEKFLRVKTVPLLSKVDDIHAICSLLKDFLRNLKEPLLTFRLNKTFMEAAEIPDEDNSKAAMYQAIGDLPQANRDTLAFLMIHLQRVAQSPNTKMDVANLAKVFGPTIVAHAVPNPDPVVMLQDIKRQPKVVECLLSLPLEYWSRFMMVEQENVDPMHVIENSNAFSTPQTPDIKVSLLGPVTTPEHQLLKTPSSSSLSQRVRSTLTKNTPRFGSKSKSATNLGRQGNFFASPMLK
ncbi:rac GTPase-activating protein 1 isoform X2 [Felis catus]|uniref:rac GTPase-activating protein 1 isoform X2 n=1 Tax=Felis catus TaxID=9685 RepID=UPI000C2F9387|nr:rac GTPase-activating protein 1 isoform X2 [Felis catus]